MTTVPGQRHDSSVQAAQCKVSAVTWLMASFKAAKADGPYRADRYPCPDCLLRRPNLPQIIGVAWLVRRLIHWKCRYAEAKASDGGLP